MCEFNNEAMGNKIALKLLMLKRVREPTLCEVQKDTEGNFSSTPAWLQNSQPHPGLPEHYLTMCSIENDESSTVDEDDVPLPRLPYDVNREVSFKLLITPAHPPKNQRMSKIPSLNSLMNGSVVIVGPPLHQPMNTEIFLILSKKLLPCCYADRSEIINIGPTLTSTGRARCYYIADSTTDHEISFSSSDGKLLYQLKGFRMKWMHGSTPYHMLHENS